MSLKFRCPKCKSLVQVAAEYAGKKVLCASCKALLLAPAISPQADTEQTVTAQPNSKTASDIQTVLPVRHAAVPKLKEGDSGRPLHHRTDVGLDHQERQGRSRPNVPKKAFNSIPLIIAISASAVVLSFCLIGGIVAFYVYWWNSMSLVPPPPGGKAAAGGGHVPFAIKEQAPDRPRQKKDENMPPVLKPPKQLQRGQDGYEVLVDFDDADVDPRSGERVKRYQFEVKRDVPYWIKAELSFRGMVRVEGVANVFGKKNNQFEPQWSEMVLITKQTGPCVVVVTVNPNDAKPFPLAIREMREEEPLPERLKSRPLNVALPSLAKVLTLNVYEKQFSSAAFSPDSKYYWIAHADGTLSYSTQTNNFPEVAYKTKDRLFAMAVDSKGRLYAQSVPDQGGNVRLTPRTAGDICVWEGLASKPVKAPGQTAGPPLPPPTKTLRMQGIVHRMINSPDGRWLYYLDVHNRRLGRIDTVKGDIDKTLDLQPPGVKSYCMTPDGKKIYCCAESNQNDVVDTATFRLERSIRLDKGNPVDIAATNQGLLFLVGTKFDPELPTTNTMMVDLRRGAKDTANVLPLLIGVFCQSVAMLPDEQAVLFSGDRDVYVCSLPQKPTIEQATVREQFSQDYYTSGVIIVSPDGRTLLHDSGVIMSISR